MAQRVFVTGGTGFVGKAVIRALLAQGFLVRCLVRPGSEHNLKGFESIDRVPGDVLQPDGLTASVEGCSALVHLVGIIREQRGRGVTFERLHIQATRNMLQLARAAGIKRFAQMSALGTRPGARARYHRTKWEAEEAVRASDLEWTIVRPDMTTTATYIAIKQWLAKGSPTTIATVQLTTSTSSSSPQIPNTETGWRSAGWS